MAIDVKFHKITKCNLGFYFVGNPIENNFITYNGDKLTNLTFQGWLPIALFSLFDKLCLVKFNQSGELVFWMLDEKFCYINHLFFNEFYKKNPGFCLAVIDKINRPFGLGDLNSQFSELDNFVNLHIYLSNRTECYDFGDCSKLNNLACIGIDIKAVAEIFDCVHPSYVGGSAPSVKVPFVFHDAFKRLNWQRYVLKESCIKTLDPFTGATCVSCNSIFFGSNKIAYFFKSDFCGYFVLIATGELGIITHAFIPMFTTILYSEHPKNGSVDNKLLGLELFQIYSKYILNRNADQKNRELCVVVGSASENIYHLVVNDLSGLEICIDNPPRKILVHENLRYLGVDGKLLLREICKADVEITTKPNSDFNTLYLFTRSNYLISDDAAQSIVKSSSMDLNYFKDGKLVVLFSIRAGRRRWLNQSFEIVKVIEFLKARYDNLTIFFDGSCLPENYTIRDVECIRLENEIVCQIVNSLDRFEYKNLVGLTPGEHIYYLGHVDIHVSTWGAGLTKSQILCKIPGVIHSNKTVYDSFADMYYCFEGYTMPVSNIVESDSTISFMDNDITADFDHRPSWTLFDNYNLKSEKVIEALIPLLPDL